MTTVQSSDWRRSEPRTVRPFLAAKKVEHILNESALRLKPGEPFERSESIHVPASEVGRLEPTIRLAIDPAELALIDDDDKNTMKCLVFIESSFVKRTELVQQIDLDLREPIDVEIPVDLARRIRFGSSSKVTIALCLMKERDKTAGKLFHKGHWLAKKTFEVTVEKESAAFKIEPLDDLVRHQFGLPEGTLYFINYLGGFNEPMEPDSPPARVYVAKEVIDRLSLATQQKTASVVESFLAAEITCFLVSKAFADFGPDEEVAQGSPLASLVKQLQESFSVDTGTIRRWSTENNGLTLRAFLHADNQSVRSILMG